MPTNFTASSGFLARNLGSHELTNRLSPCIWVCHWGAAWMLGPQHESDSLPIGPHPVPNPERVPGSCVSDERKTLVRLPPVDPEPPGRIKSPGTAQNRVQPEQDYVRRAEVIENRIEYPSAVIRFHRYVLRSSELPCAQVQLANKRVRIRFRHARLTGLNKECARLTDFVPVMTSVMNVDPTVGLPRCRQVVGSAHQVSWVVGGRRTTRRSSEEENNRID